MFVISTAARAHSEHVIWPQCFVYTCSSLTGLFVHTNGRELTTELANGAATLRVYVESLDKRHPALWPHLCGEALRRRSTAPSERQGDRCGAASAALGDV